jgi:hypothetical protein
MSYNWCGQGWISRLRREAGFSIPDLGRSSGLPPQPLEEHPTKI